MQQRNREIANSKSVLGRVAGYWKRICRPKTETAAGNGRYVVNGQVRADTHGDATAILDIPGGRLFKLNQTGSRIWAGIEAHQPIEAIARCLGDEYHMTPEDLAMHVTAYVDQLSALGLITPVSR
jgi:hypothetical protein